MPSTDQMTVPLAAPVTPQTKDWVKPTARFAVAGTTAAIVTAWGVTVQLTLTGDPEEGVTVKV
jgi:hypothetical protein